MISVHIIYTYWSFYQVHLFNCSFMPYQQHVSAFRFIDMVKTACCNCVLSLRPPNAAV